MKLLLNLDNFREWHPAWTLSQGKLTFICDKDGKGSLQMSLNVVLSKDLGNLF